MVRLRRIPMRRLGIALIAIASLTNPVAAADLPVKAPPAGFLPFTWTGPYAGAFGRYGSWKWGGLDAQGGFGGGQNWDNIQTGGPVPRHESQHARAVIRSHALNVLRV